MMHSEPDDLLHLLRNEHLRRLARFALIDGIPAPWSLGAQAPETVEPNMAEQADG